MNNIKIREVMLHQAGFIPYIPFHNAIQPSDYSRDSSAAYPTKVADNYYVRKNYFKDVMWPKMLNSPIKTRGTYVYSDISMYVMKEIAERITGIPLDQYVQDNFYKPLGMQTAGFYLEIGSQETRLSLRNRILISEKHYCKVMYTIRVPHLQAGYLVMLAYLPVLTT